jgi:hypothetical protein
VLTHRPLGDILSPNDSSEYLLVTFSKTQNNDSKPIDGQLKTRFLKLYQFTWKQKSEDSLKCSFVI